MASTMASTLALSRPSEKFGTHSTSVDITGKNIGHRGPPQPRARASTPSRLWADAGAAIVRPCALHIHLRGLILMRISCGLPNIGRLGNADNVLKVAERAESLAYDSLWTIERLLWPVKPQVPYPVT